MNKVIFRRYLSWQKCILILFIFPVAATAQTLTLPDAVDKTLANYPLLKQRASEVAASRAHLTTVNGNRLPSLMLHDQLTMGTANALQGAYFPLGIVPSVSGNYEVAQANPNPGNVAVSFLQWEFCNFGYYKARQNESKALLAVSEANLGSDKYLLTQNVISLYLDWLKKYRLLHIENENMQRAQVILTAIRATVLSGLKPGVDSSTASAVYSGARISYLQALDEYNYDKITLLTYSGQNNYNMIPDTNFVTVSLLQGPAQLPLSDSVVPGHPLLDVYQKQYEEQLAAVDATSKKYLPHLGLDGAAWVRNSGISYGGVYPGSLSDGLPYNRSNYLLGLTASYNLLDLKHRHDQVSEGKFLAEAKFEAVQTQRLTLDRMMQQANIAYTTTLEKLKEIPVQLHSAQQAYGQQMALYKSGLNTLVEVTNAQYVLLQAETSYVIAQDELLQLLYIRAGLGGQLDNFLKNLKH